MKSPAQGGAFLAPQRLRLSFMRSPGKNSDAPFDCPTVPWSCMRSPGLNSDAPGPVFVFDFCISWPGLYWDAPGELVPPPVCAKANEAVPSNKAVTIAIVFVILTFLLWSPGRQSTEGRRCSSFWSALAAATDPQFKGRKSNAVPRLQPNARIRTCSAICKSPAVRMPPAFRAERTRARREEASRQVPLDRRTVFSSRYFARTTFRPRWQTSSGVTELPEQVKF